MKKKIKILGLTLCGAAALGLGACVASNMYNANAATELIVPQEYHFEEEYVYGETFIVPTPSSVSIKTGALETSAVSVVLRFPDGTAKSEGSYTLDKTGTYEITYYNANGVSATQTFVVNKNYYGISEGTSAEYVNDLVGAEGKEGILVTLEDGKSFTFNKTVNLNDYAGEALEVCKIFPMYRNDPDVNPDASTVSVKLVDCYDSTKYVEYYIWCGEAGQGVYYMGAGASTQLLTGLEQNKNRPHEMTEAYNGDMYKIHRPQRYQSKTAWGTGMASRDNGELVNHDGLTLIWDLSNHQMKTKTNNTLRLLTDIDSTEIYGTSALDVDSFFTTGEVYLNVEVYNYTTNTFQLGIESIFDMKGEELQNGKLLDKEAPELFIDVEPTKDNVIYLQKGQTMTLPTFERVLDYNFYGDTSVAVYRNYGKNGEALLNVENGVFTPTVLGNYTAVYTAKDSYGNEGKYLLEMVVLDEDNIVYAENPLTELVAAKANVLPYIEAMGLNKEVVAEVFVTTPNGEKIKLDYNENVNGYEYVPEYAGTYNVTYLFKDNVYEEGYSYSVSCVDKNAATFKKPFAFPAYFIKGASYTVSPVTAYTAGNGGFNENAATVSVSVDGGAYQTLSDAQMQAYKVEANQTLRFKASYGDSFIESKLYSVVDVGYGKKTTEKNYLNYLQGNYTAAALLENGAEYTFESDAKLQFVNMISSANFKMTFALQTATAESVVITLRDAQDPDNSYIAYTYYKTPASTVILNAKQYEGGKLIFENSVYTKYMALVGEYSLSYSSLGLTTGDVLLEGVKAFAEDRALVEISVNGTTGGCAVTLSQLNNQAFSDTIRESKPQMAYTECNGVQEIGSVQEIAPCYVSSVMCSVLFQDAKVTVLTPNGEVATSEDGVRLESVSADKIYRVKLTQVGQYRVTYEASCIGSTRTNGQDTLKDSDYYIVNVSESEAPTIVFKDGSNTQTTIELKVGSTHTVKEFTVTDNISASENIKVYTMILDKGFMLEENGYGVDSYTFKNVGEFVVYVLAYDELGNSSALYYNVVVS